MTVAWICLFHFRIWNTNLAVRLTGASRTDELQDIFKTTHVQWVVFHGHEFYFILKTSSRVGHTPVDGLRDDDRLSRQTSRPERLQLTVLFMVAS